MSTPPTATVDIARFLKLTDAGAQGVLGLFLLTQCVLAITTLGSVRLPWLSILALLIMISTAVLVMRPGLFPLARGATVAVLVSVAVTTALVSWNLPTEGWPGYASWHIGANTFILLALGLRGRVALSWVGMACMAGITIAWTATTGQGVLTGVNLVDRDAATLLIGTMFALAFHRTAKKIADYHEAERRHAALEAETAAGEREHQRQAERLQTRVAPVLRLIASDGELSSDQRDEMRILEAGLRDEIRAGSLLRDPLTSSVRRARERGVNLLLLDDSGGVLPAEPVLRDTIAWAAGAVDSTESGRIVIRLRPPHHPRFASLHIEDGDHARSIEYP